MNTHDIIDEADMFGGLNASLTADRFDRPSSAISLINGYYKLPPRVYFSLSYSFLVWVRPRALTAWARILEVSNGAQNDNVYFSLNEAITGGIANTFCAGNTIYLNAKAPTKLTLNQWQHVAFVFNYPMYYLYLNGIQIFTLTTTKGPNNVTRTINFVGKSVNLPASANSNTDLDEMKIFNRALSLTEVRFEMNNSIFT